MRAAAMGVALAMLCLGAACDDSQRVCVPNQSLLCPCAGGATGVQSCNESGSGFTPCECGTTGQPDAVVTADTSLPDAGIADDGAPDVSAPDASSDGSGDCVADVQKKCDGQSVYWYDSCGKRGDKVESCAVGTVCETGACVSNCTPHASKSCVGNHVFWFDACGGQESVAESCDDLQYCVNASCVKPVYDGKWYIESVTPNDPTFQGTYFVLKVDGTVATLDEPDAPTPQTFTGTISGHTMKVKGTKSGSLGGEVTTDIIANFSAPSDLKGQPPPVVFEGTWIDSVVGFPLSWKIKGTRQ